MKDRSSAYIFVFSVLLLIFLTHGFQFVGWRLYVKQTYEAIPALLVLWVLINYNRIKQSKLPFSSIVIYLCTYPIVLILLKPVIAGGKTFDVLLEIPVILGWTSIFALYFIFWHYNVSEKVVINILLTFGVSTFVLQFWQQMNPHIPMFGVSKWWIENTDEEQISSIRNNLFRLHIGSYMIQMLCLFYCWNRLLKRLNINNIVLVSIFLVSIYLYLTRQVFMIVITMMIISVFSTENDGIKKRWGVLFLFLLGVYIAVYWNELISYFIDDYIEDTYSTDIRRESGSFFINEMIQNPITLILGNGHQWELETTWAKKGYFLNDVGAIGECYYFGIIWVIVFYRTVYTIIFKYGNYIPIYIKMYLGAVTIDSIMIFPYRKGVEAFIWVSVMYISSLYITQKCEKLNNGN